MFLLDFISNNYNISVGESLSMKSGKHTALGLRFESCWDLLLTFISSHFSYFSSFALLSFFIIITIIIIF
jgi:hypothetical protein